MPAYVNSPFSKPRLAAKGMAAYLYGSFDTRVGDSKLYLTNSALTTNVATVTVQQTAGPLPVVGGYVSIINSTAGSGALNVNRAVITGVTVDAATGAGTLTFALTNSNIVSVADAGTVIVEPAETSEAIAAGASVAVLIQAPEGDSQFTVPVAITFPTLPTAVTVSLQAALKNLGSEFTSVQAPPVAIVAGGVQTVGPVTQVVLQRGYLYRLLVSGLTGTGTIIAKIGG